MVSRGFYSKTKRVIKSMTERKFVQGETTVDVLGGITWSRNGVFGLAANFGVACAPIPLQGTTANDRIGEEIEITSVDLSIMLLAPSLGQAGGQFAALSGTFGYYRLIVWQQLTDVLSTNVNLITNNGMFLAQNAGTIPSSTQMFDQLLQNPIDDNSENILQPYDRKHSSNYVILYDQMHRITELASGVTPNTSQIHLNITPVYKTAKILTTNDVDENTVNNWIFWTVIGVADLTQGNTLMCVARTNFMDS